MSLARLVMVLLVLLPLMCSILPTLRPTMAQGDFGLFVARIRLIDRDFLDPVKEFAGLRIQAGAEIGFRWKTSQRQWLAILPTGEDQTIAVQAIAPDGREAYDRRTIRYEYDQDPDRDGYYDIALVLDFLFPKGNSASPSNSREGQPPPPPSPTAPGEDEAATGQQQNSPWAQSVAEAAGEQDGIPGLEPTDEPISIPREVEEVIDARPEYEIPPGERRIVLSGYELTRGDPDVWTEAGAARRRVGA